MIHNTMSTDKIKSKSILEAIQKDRPEEVEARLALGESVDAVFTMNRTALHCAAAKTNTRIVEILLKANPDLKKCDSNNFTALHVSCSRKGEDSLKIVDLLLAAGAGAKDILDAVNKFGRTALEEAVVIGNVAVVNTLIGAGATVTDGARRIAREDEAKDLMDIFGANAACGVGEKESTMSVSEEKEALLKRLKEIEEQEATDLETKLRNKKIELDQVKKDFKKKKDESKKELDILESQVLALKTKLSCMTKEEEKEVKRLQLDISQLSNDLDKKKVSQNLDVAGSGCLDCPVCLDVCKPPVQILQCPEGHIMCGDCAERPELEICPQCRVVLAGRLSRNRALEELARKTFPREEEESRRLRAARGGAGAGPGAGQRSRAGRHGRGHRQPPLRSFRVAQNQVDQPINFSGLHLLADWAEAGQQQEQDFLFPDSDSEWGAGAGQHIVYAADSGNTYWSDDTAEDIEEEEDNDVHNFPSVSPPHRTGGSQHHAAGWGGWGSQRSPRRGHRRRSPGLAPPLPRRRSPGLAPVSGPGLRQPRAAPTSAPPTLSRGAVERGGRRHRVRQWGRPSDLRFLR